MATLSTSACSRNATSPTDILLTAIPSVACVSYSGAIDDKIIAVLKDDGAFGAWRDISHCPTPLIDRLRHYFLTCKTDPGSTPSAECFIAEVYGRNEAHAVIAFLRSFMSVCIRSSLRSTDANHESIDENRASIAASPR